MSREYKQQKIEIQFENIKGKIKYQKRINIEIVQRIYNHTNPKLTLMTPLLKYLKGQAQSTYISQQREKFSMHACDLTPPIKFDFKQR